MSEEKKTFITEADVAKGLLISAELLEAAGESLQERDTKMCDAITNLVSTTLLLLSTSMEAERFYNGRS